MSTAIEATVSAVEAAVPNFAAGGVVGVCAACVYRMG